YSPALRGVKMRALTDSAGPPDRSDDLVGAEAGAGCEGHEAWGGGRRKGGGSHDENSSMEASRLSSVGGGAGKPPEPPCRLPQPRGRSLPVMTSTTGRCAIRAR